MGILLLSPDDVPDAGVQPMGRVLSEPRDCRAELVQTGWQSPVFHRQLPQCHRRRRVVRIPIAL
jgi:hypothetical protein